MVPTVFTTNKKSLNEISAEVKNLAKDWEHDRVLLC
jgi:hypothetical protein